jgi:hypothetical protein
LTEAFTYSNAVIVRRNKIYYNVAGTRRFDDDKLPISLPYADEPVSGHCSPRQAAAAGMKDCRRSQCKTRLRTQPLHAQRTPGTTASDADKLGGLPIVIDGKIIGGIGISGGRAPQNAQVAEAGLAAIKQTPLVAAAKDSR